jgi:hypothetical protein
MARQRPSPLEGGVLSRHRVVLSFVLAALCGQHLQAALVFNHTDDGTDTTVNWSGTLNTVGLTVEDTGATSNGAISVANSPIIFAMTSSPKLRFNTPFSSTTPFGTSGLFNVTNRTGDEIGLNTFGQDLFVTQGYTSGSPLSGSFQILGQTVASMGIVETPNAFVLTNGDTISVGGAAAAVPEPGQIAASLLLLVGLGGYIALKRPKKQPATAATA